MKTKSLRAGLFMLMAALLATAGCLPQTQEPAPGAFEQPELKDSSWQLEQYGTPTALKSAIPGNIPTIDFAAGELSGSAGCNSYFGSYTYDTDGSLAVSQLGNTEMACMEAGVMDQEQSFLDTLRLAESYRVVQGKLRIVGGGDLLVLARATEASTPAEAPDEEEEPEPVEQPALKNTSWVLNAYGEPGNLTAAIASDRPTMDFTTNEVNGSAGCNSYFGTYESDTDSSLAISDIGMTAMYCTDEDVRDQEEAFVDALALADKYEMVGETLRITGGGKLLLLGQAEEEPEPVEQPALKNTSWVLEAYGTPGHHLTGAISGKEPTLEFATSDLGGHGGCNSYFGSYDSDTDGTLEITDVGSTMMLCSDVDVRNQEQAFLEAIQLAETYQVVEGTLRIEGGGKVMLLEEEPEPVEQPALKNTSWVLEAYGTPGHLTGAISGKEPTLEFATSDLGGHGGCNSYFGSYDSDTDGSLEVTGVGSTMMLCANVDVRNQEHAYLEALQLAEIYEVTGGQLRIAGGGKVMVLSED